MSTGLGSRRVSNCLVMSPGTKACSDEYIYIETDNCQTWAQLRGNVDGSLLVKPSGLLNSKLTH